MGRWVTNDYRVKGRAEGGVEEFRGRKRERRKNQERSI
jgi:hypothetical protein